MLIAGLTAAVLSGWMLRVWFESFSDGLAVFDSSRGYSDSSVYPGVVYYKVFRYVHGGALGELGVRRDPILRDRGALT